MKIGDFISPFLIFQLTLLAIFFVTVIIIKLKKPTPIVLIPSKQNITAEDIELAWEVTSFEKGRRVRRGMLWALIFLPFLVLVMAMDNDWEGIKEWPSILFYSGCVLLVVYVLTYFLSGRKYRINNDGISIEGGKKKKDYLWGDIEYFSKDIVAGLIEKVVEPQKEEKVASIKDKIVDNALGGSGPSPEMLLIYFKKMSSTTRGAFYLLLRQRKIVKNIVVIYPEPDNYERVYSFLSSKLSERKNAGSYWPARYYFR